MTKLSDLKARLLENPEVRAEYEALADEFALPEVMVQARKKAKLSQQDVADRMNTKQSAVARLEGGVQDAKISTLRDYAEAVGMDLEIRLRPKAPSNHAV